MADAFTVLEYQMGWRTQGEYDALASHLGYTNTSYGYAMIRDFAPKASQTRMLPPQVIITGE